MIKSRIAPTPSGLLHRGNAFNFLLTSSIVQSAGGELRLRIDDLDAPRIRTQYLEDIFETLNWLGISWTKGPRDITDHVASFQQKFRLDRYQELLDQLVANGQVFACTCSRKDILANSKDGQYPGTCRLKNLPLNTPDASWRLITPQKTIIQFKDALLGDVSTDLYSQQRDFVVRRRDGLPAYHIASLADDMDFGMNVIVRGEDLLLSTSVQLYLAQQLALPSFENIQFYHHPLIMTDNGEKLSKSAGSTSIKSLREAGMNRQEFIAEFEDWCSGINLGKQLK